MRHSIDPKKQILQQYQISAGRSSEAEISQYHDEGLKARKKLLMARFSEQLDPPNCVVDLGCGPGTYCGPLSQKGFEAIGVDFSLDVLARAVERWPTLTFLAADVCRLPIASNRADAILMLGILEYIPDLNEAYKESLRVLKPGGRVFIMALSMHSLYFKVGLSKDDPTKYAVALRRFEPSIEAARLRGLGLIDVKLTPVYVFPGLSKPLGLVLQSLSRFGVVFWPLAHAFLLEGAMPKE